MTNNQAKPGTTRPDSARGFTLLEVLVALSIAGIALGILLSVSTDSVYRSANLQQKIIAQWVAENKATELRLTKSTLTVGNQSSQITMLKRNWLVKTQISTTPDPFVNKIRVEVYATDQTDKRITQLTSYVAKKQ